VSSAANVRTGDQIPPSGFTSSRARPDEAFVSISADPLHIHHIHEVNMDQPIFYQGFNLTACFIRESVGRIYIPSRICRLCNSLRSSRRHHPVEELNRSTIHYGGQTCFPFHARWNRPKAHLPHQGDSGKFSLHRII